MASDQVRMLLIDDDPDLGKLIVASLPGVETTFTTSPREALTLLAQQEFDVVMTDVQMPEMNGIELCERAVGTRPDVPVVVLTSHGKLDVAVEAMRVGAFDFVGKPFTTEGLRLAIDRAAQQKSLRAEVRRLRDERPRPTPDGLLGESAPMVALRETLERVSASDVTVLITGESGTGKEVVARLLHRRGKRASGPFVAINCAAVPEPLLESEMFGHVRGAFTDARSSRIGLFQRASGGTVFLDEIGDMPPALQAKLLRVLQERTVRPLGGDEEIPVDVRILAATHRDLDAAVADKAFREDLYFRLNVLNVHLPPLRARGSDALLLANTFVAGAAARQGKAIRGLSRGAAEKVLAYDWPGNVRELQNAMERAVALGSFEEIVVEDLPEKVAAHRARQVVIPLSDPTELSTLEEVERRYISSVLEAVGGHRTEAARILGLDRKTLYRKLRAYGVADDPEQNR